jgi:hypothetical protein
MTTVQSSLGCRKPTLRFIVIKSRCRSTDFRRKNKRNFSHVIQNHHWFDFIISLEYSFIAVDWQWTDARDAKRNPFLFRSWLMTTVQSSLGCRNPTLRFIVKKSRCRSTDFRRKNKRNFSQVIQNHHWFDFIISLEYNFFAVNWQWTDARDAERNPLLFRSWLMTTVQSSLG